MPSQNPTFDPAFSAVDFQKKQPFSLYGGIILTNNKKNNECSVLRTYREYSEVTNRYLIEKLSNRNETPSTINYLTRKMGEPQSLIFIACLLNKPICTLGDIARELKSHSKAKSVVQLGRKAGLVKSIFKKNKHGLSRNQIFLESSYRKTLMEIKELH